MWICPNCSETNDDDSWVTCWKCNAEKDVTTAAQRVAPIDATDSIPIHYTSHVDAGTTIALVAGSPNRGVVPFVLFDGCDNSVIGYSSIRSRYPVKDIAAARDHVYAITHDNKVFGIRRSNAEVSDYGYFDTPDLVSSNSLVVTMGAVVTYSSVANVARWDLLTHKKIDSWKAGNCTGIAICATDSTIACTDGYYVNIWDVASGRLTHKVCAHDANVFGLSMHNNCVLSGGADGKVAVIDIETGNVLDRISITDIPITAISTAGGNVLAGTRSGEIISVTIERGQLAVVGRGTIVSDSIAKIGGNDDCILISYLNGAVVSWDRNLQGAPSIQVPSGKIPESVDVVINAQEFKGTPISVSLKEISAAAFPSVEVNARTKTILGVLSKALKHATQ